MNNLEKIYQLEQVVDRGLKELKKERLLLSTRIMEEKVDIWGNIFNDLDKLEKYIELGQVLNTGIELKEKVTYTLEPQGENVFKVGYKETVYGGYKQREGIYTICKEGLYMDDDGFMPIEDMVKTEMLESLLINWKAAYENIQNDLVKKIELRISNKIEKSKERQEFLEGKAGVFGV